MCWLFPLLQAVLFSPGTVTQQLSSGCSTVRKTATSAEGYTIFPNCCDTLGKGSMFLVTQTRAGLGDSIWLLKKTKLDCQLDCHQEASMGN